MFPDMPFLQNDGPEQYFKKQFPETANDKSFAKIQKIHWATVLIVQETKNAAKKQHMKLNFQDPPCNSENPKIERKTTAKKIFTQFNDSNSLQTSSL